MLVVVCCLLLTVALRCLWFVSCRLLFVVRYVLAAAGCLFSRCGCTGFLFDVNAMSVVCCLLIVMCRFRLLFVVGVVRRLCCLFACSLKCCLLYVVCSCCCCMLVFVAGCCCFCYRLVLFNDCCSLYLACCLLFAVWCVVCCLLCDCWLMLAVC